MSRERILGAIRITLDAETREATRRQSAAARLARPVVHPRPGRTLRPTGELLQQFKDFQHTLGVTVMEVEAPRRNTIDLRRPRGPLSRRITPMMHQGAAAIPTPFTTSWVRRSCNAQAASLRTRRGSRTGAGPTSSAPGEARPSGTQATTTTPSASSVRWSDSSLAAVRLSAGV